MTNSTSKVSNKALDRAQLLTKFETKSSAIRALTSEGWTRREIADRLEIRYQHVRNVQVTLLKKDIK